MQKPNQEQMYELINKVFTDMALSLGEVSQKHSADEKLIIAMANSIEALYYQAIDRLETISGTRVTFDSAECVRRLHPHPAIDSLLKAIGFMPLLKKDKRL